MRYNKKNIVFFGILILLYSTVLLKVVYSVPEGPDSIVNYANETRTPSSAYMLNTSGGYISIKEARFGISAGSQSNGQVQSK